MPHRTYLWLRLILDVIRKESGPTKERLGRSSAVFLIRLTRLTKQFYQKFRIRTRNEHGNFSALSSQQPEPLTLNEMNIALAIEDHHRSYEDLKGHLKKQTQFKDMVRQLCGLFVNVIDQKIYLIHQTAKEVSPCTKRSI